ncbi:hypothetical protein, partial [Microcoleus sp. N9_A3]|uniref:hypothetical protein n=1 Tax=Microcoleus sp. N9_A3 TaxID=3055382 RepID=UPI002FD22ED5
SSMSLNLSDFLRFLGYFSFTPPERLQGFAVDELRNSGCESALAKPSKKIASLEVSSSKANLTR